MGSSFTKEEIVRALYQPGFQPRPSSKLEVEGKDHHHLCNVVRAKVGDTVLLLNGRGDRYFSQILEIKKKKLLLEIIKSEKELDKRKFHLAICLPKKEALEEILKIAVEVGVKSLSVYTSDYSQSYSIKKERVNKILKSSYEQSNSSYDLEVHFDVKLKPSNLEGYRKVWFFNSQKKDREVKGESATAFENDLILIGPEGGFSPEEIKSLQSCANVEESFLDGVNILRAPTAVAYSLGYLSD